MHLIGECADNAVVTWTEPTVSDNSGYYTLISSYSPGELIPYGVTSVSYTATDPAGNTVSFWFNVTVKAQTGKQGTFSFWECTLCELCFRYKFIKTFFVEKKSK